MLNKFKNLFIRERQLNIRIGIIILLVIGSVLLVRKQEMQAAQLEKIKADKQLIAKIPDLKKQINDLEKLRSGKISSGKEKPEKEGLVLKGILMGNNIYYAAIGDTFYLEGESCGDFNIFKIVLDYVIVENKNTKERKILYLNPSPD